VDGRGGGSGSGSGGWGDRDVEFAAIGRAGTSTPPLGRMSSRIPGAAAATAISNPGTRITAA